MVFPKDAYDRRAEESKKLPKKKDKGQIKQFNNKDDVKDALLLYSGKAPNGRLGFKDGNVALLDDAAPVMVDSYWQITKVADGGGNEV